MKKNANVNLIASRLNSNGFECYVVGGAVRDFQMGKEPHDIDLTSNASPADIKRIFADFQVLEIGEAFGITAVVVNGIPYEIAQYRKDIGGNGRRPDGIEIVRDIEIDLARRDFTMNAMAWDPIKEIMRDPFAGTLDIHDKEICFVGNPIDRITEDKLRILRAFRFMSQLSFTLDKAAMKAIEKFVLNGCSFSGVSQERITAELSKLLIGPSAFETVKLMFELNIMQMLIPETARLHEAHNNSWHTETMKPFGNTILAHVMFVFQAANDVVCGGQVGKFDAPLADDNEKLVLMLAALLHDIGKPFCREKKTDGSSRFLNHDTVGADLTREILVRMRFPSEIVDRVASLVRRHMNAHDLPKMKKVHKIRRLLGSKDFHLLFNLSACDTLGTAASNGVPNTKDMIDFDKCVTDLVKQFGQVLPEPIVTGVHLIAEGLKPGPDFKKRLDVAFNMQLDGTTDKKKLVNHAVGLTV